MAESIVSEVVAKLIQILSETCLEEIAPYFGGRKRLRKLQQTMMMIHARVLDAERRREAENGALIKLWLKKLKHVLYKMEDMFEEVALIDTKIDRNHGGKLSKTMSLLFSGSSLNKKVTQEAKAVLDEFIILTSEMQSLNLGVCSVDDEQTLVKLSNKERSSSFVLEEEIIGRDEDREAILKMVDNNDVEGRISVIPIVGMGGLGKTTLAQLVFNDENVVKSFDLRGWVCVGEASNMEDLTRKILSSVIGNDCNQHLCMEQLQTCLRNAVHDKKYLLVLDDLWDEDRERWLSLNRFLCAGKRGSKIIATSRSRVVALNMGTVGLYELKGLSEEKSWELFKNLAFKGQEKRNPELISIGQEIVKKCANVPLAIRTIAGLLYSKDDVIEWKFIKDKEFGMIKQNGGCIMSTLKLSYDHLPSHLKQCFAYCSVFPKDYVFKKQNLIDLWMAQGFIISSHCNQSLEDIGDVYFMELLRRAFFQDDIRCDDGETISCKMHDLMHDLAQLVAGEDSALVHGAKEVLNEKIWHASFIVGDSSWEVPSSLLAMKQMRSLLLLSHTTFNVKELFSSLTCLRALDLLKADCENLPNSVGKLVHLRYLRLGCSIVSLSDCITLLVNLQTLDLRACKLLRQLPNGFHKLINLRHLYNNKVGSNDMPPRFGLLTSLYTLDKFVVGENNGLNALAYLNNLGGRLVIYLKKSRREAISEATMASLKSKKLVELVLRWSSMYGNTATHANKDEEILILEYMQPPPTLKRLHVMDWAGVRFPSWGIDESPCLLPNLVSLCIQFCHRCQYLPPMSQLPHLRFLELAYLEVLEYIDTGGYNNTHSASAAAYFPSLERLELHNLSELKGWSRMEVKDDIHKQYCSLQRVFPRVSWLRIYSCPKLRSMPLAKSLESLEAYDIHGTLLKHLLHGEVSSTTTTSEPHSPTPFTLRILDIESVHELDSLAINFSSLESLKIKGCHELTSLMAESPTSLRQLVLNECGRLRNISGAVQHLSSLEDLKVQHCEDVDLWDDDELGTSGSVALLAWKALKSLSSLSLSRVSKLKYLPRSLCYVSALQKLYMDELSELRCLPEWIGNLTQLRQLSIRNCHKLVALPKSFHQLTTLQELNIWKCTKLEKRCEKPDGQDWPLIPSTVSICRY